MVKVPCGAMMIGLLLPAAALLWPIGAVPSASAQSTPVKSAFVDIDKLVDDAIQRGDCPGAVVMVMHRADLVHQKAYGKRALKPTTEEMTPDTVFDLASLTKPIATATCIHILAERGKLKFSERVATYWPEFGANGKEAVTIDHLLLHTSGLTADNALADYQDGSPTAYQKIAQLKLEARAGERFRYSDVGFIVLGHLIEKLTGKTVAEFAQAEVFQPLKMTSTGFTPPAEIRSRCAPTAVRDGKMLQGVVHDPRAAAMKGIAGHAGLFGSGADLIRYARMLMNDGELDGVRILSPLSVARMTAPIAVPGGLRSRGWDVDTGFSSPRGEFFAKAGGYGHTGFTGTSFWVDRSTKTAVVILTNRVHISEKVQVTRLRREVASAVAQKVGIAAPATADYADVSCGIDVLEAEKFKRLQGRRIGLVTNHTGRDRSGAATADILHQADGLKLVALFSPEHGIRGELDQAVIVDGTDKKTGLTVFSLYGKRRKPDAETLKGIDTLVYDIQDIGCRFYTYISTLGNVLEAASEHGIRVVVLDRPNPIGGTAIDGPLTDPGRESFIAYHSLPLRHGMTVGEIAKMLVAERKWKVDLDVVACRDWKRGMTMDRTRMAWVNPSPNMRTLTAAMLYPGIGLLETTNISVGRGTERPFEWIGAPWMEARSLAESLNRRDIPGVRFVPMNITPTSSVHAGKACGGVHIIVDRWDRLDPLRTGLEVATALRDLYPEQWDSKNYDRLLVHRKTYQAFLAGGRVGDLQASWSADVASFRERRKPFLIYSE